MRALLPASVIVCVALATVGCGSHVLSDRQHEKEVAGGIGLPATVDCRGPTCSLVVKQQFRQSSEAWFIALPVVHWIDVDSNLFAVRTIKLTILDTRSRREAVFRCSLRHQVKVTGARPAKTGVATIQEICKSSFGPLPSRYIP